MSLIKRLIDTHVLQAIAIVWLIWLWTGSPEYAAATNAALWVMREFTQAEARYIRKWPYRSQSMKRWQMWFERAAWNRSSVLDFALPTITGAALGLVLGGVQ